MRWLKTWWLLLINLLPCWRRYVKNITNLQRGHYKQANSLKIRTPPLRKILTYMWFFVRWFKTLRLLLVPCQLTALLKALAGRFSPFLTFNSVLTLLKSRAINIIKGRGEPAEKVNCSQPSNAGWLFLSIIERGLSSWIVNFSRKVNKTALQHPVSN